MARGLEAFAALAGREGKTELAVQLAAAAAALREAAGLPALAGARVENYLVPARRLLGDAAVTRLWASGRAMPSESAVALALGPPSDTAPETAPQDAAAEEDRTLTVVNGFQVASAPPSSLTQREREVVALVASGRSNKAIAEELFISPATAARHVANILGKLGFNSRAQIAAWAADRPPHISDPGEDPPSVRQA